MTGVKMLKRQIMAAFAAIFLGTTAMAQGQLTPVITVNDLVVTQYELTQRTRLLELFNTPGDLNTVARTALIEDRLKQQEMARFGVTLPPEALQRELEAFAGRANLSLPEFTQVLAQNGIDLGTLSDFVEVGAMWRDFVRGRFRREVTITDTDVERAIANQGNARSQREVLLSEIIIAPSPEQAAAARDAATQIAQMRTFAAFEAAARQVSALPSREDGGRLGWLPIDNYPPQIRSIILDLEPGEVTEPIDIPNGAIALFQLRDTREALLPRQVPVSLEYAAYYIPGGTSQSGLRQAAEVSDQVDTCDDLYGVARNQPAEVLERVTLAPSAISGDIAIELARLDPGEVSYNLTRNNGETLVFLMLCARNAAGAENTDPAAVRQQILSQRLTARADALLEDLRASAVIRP